MLEHVGFFIQIKVFTNLLHQFSTQESSPPFFSLRTITSLEKIKNRDEGKWRDNVSGYKTSEPCMWCTLQLTFYITYECNVTCGQLCLINIDLLLMCFCSTQHSCFTSAAAAPGNPQRNCCDFFGHCCRVIRLASLYFYKQISKCVHNSYIVTI